MCYYKPATQKALEEAHKEIARQREQLADLKNIEDIAEYWRDKATQYQKKADQLEKDLEEKTAVVADAVKFWQRAAEQCQKKIIRLEDELKAVTKPVAPSHSHSIPPYSFAITPATRAHDTPLWLENHIKQANEYYGRALDERASRLNKREADLEAKEKQVRDECSKEMLYWKEKCESAEAYAAHLKEKLHNLTWEYETLIAKREHSNKLVAQNFFYAEKEYWEGRAKAAEEKLEDIGEIIEE